MSIDPRPQELVVDARSLKPNLMGGRNGDEKEESRERCVSSRSDAFPGSANKKELFATDACGDASWFWWACRLVGLVSACRLKRKGVGSPRESVDC